MSPHNKNARDKATGTLPVTGLLPTFLSTIGQGLNYLNDSLYAESLSEEDMEYGSGRRKHLMPEGAAAAEWNADTVSTTRLGNTRKTNTENMENEMLNSMLIKNIKPYCASKPPTFKGDDIDGYIARDLRESFFCSDDSTDIGFWEETKEIWQDLVSSFTDIEEERETFISYELYQITEVDTADISEDSISFTDEYEDFEPSQRSQAGKTNEPILSDILKGLPQTSCNLDLKAQRWNMNLCVLDRKYSFNSFDSQTDDESFEPRSGVRDFVVEGFQGACPQGPSFDEEELDEVVEKVIVIDQVDSFSKEDYEKSIFSDDTYEEEVEEEQEAPEEDQAEGQIQEEEEESREDEHRQNPEIESLDDQQEENKDYDTDMSNGDSTSESNDDSSRSHGSTSTEISTQSIRNSLKTRAMRSSTTLRLKQRAPEVPGVPSSILRARRSGHKQRRRRHRRRHQPTLLLAHE